MGEVALASLMMVACWEHTVGYRWFIFWIPFQNMLGQLLVFRFHYLGHVNSALSIFVGTELDPRGHGLSHLKPEVNIGEQIRVVGGFYYELINGPNSGKNLGYLQGTS
jgi:hypothetical protein